MADSDTSLFMTLLIIFVLMGTLLPFVTTAFSQQANTYDVEGVQDAVGQGLTTNPVTVLDVVLSIFLIFFWTFAIPALVEVLFLLPMRILFWYLFVRLIRGV